MTKLRSILPKLIRLKDAPFYLGMDRHKFNADVRPYVVEIRDKGRGVRFDRLDLDAWADQYKSRNGRGDVSIGEKQWQNHNLLDSVKKAESGTLKKESKITKKAGSENRLASQYLNDVRQNNTS
jgi:hypothetical protein